MQGMRGIQLAILDTFDRYCWESGLRYTLAYGTLLGAMRHSGYIPWDDDIDVMMPRADYDRLCEAGAVGPFEVRSLRRDSTWTLPYAKVCDTSTRVVEQAGTRPDLGVNIDVFPVDVVPESLLARTAHLAVCRAFESIQTAVPRPGRCAWKSAVLRIGNPLLGSVRGPRLAALRTWHARLPRDTSGRAGVVVGSFPWHTPQVWLHDTKRGIFEGRRSRLPANPDGVLSAVYGDYLKLPPVEKQASHHAMTAHRR